MQLHRIFKLNKFPFNLPLDKSCSMAYNDYTVDSRDDTSVLPLQFEIKPIKTLYLENLTRKTKRVTLII